MGMVARNTNADINVIALIGERGREVLEFIENDLGPEGLARSVVVVATSDKSPLIKIRAAHTATTIAEYFRDQNSDVILMMDSITRYAMAYREISLSAGEPPGQKVILQVYLLNSLNLWKELVQKEFRVNNRYLLCPC